jgi:exodeoxyribonuclease VII large subunit
MSIPGKPLTVYEVTSHIKRLMEGDDLLSQVTVEGEISNLVKAASGHAYFTLKDAKATLKAAIWAGTRRRITCELSNGAKVIATGGISVYEPRGEYQIIINDLKPAGLGALYEAFEKRKAQLAAEGLFDADRKKPLPFLPRGIGLVTSPKGAVVQDMFRVIRRRFPNMPLFLVPSKVQGDGAEEEIIRGIARLDRDPRVDVIIIARGGGSLEDLWAFNGEALARAIAAATKPLVSAVGHETDTTIADFVADRRAATPSVAGELVVPVKEDLLRGIATWRLRLQRALKGQIALSRRRLEKALACRFLRKPEAWISEKKLVVANLSRDLEFRFREFFKKARHHCDMLLSRLHSLNPRAVLQRGFLMATDEKGRVLTSITQAAPGQTVALAFADGTADAVIKTITPSS